MTIEERLEVVERELAETKAGLAVSRRRNRRLWIGLGLSVVVCALAWSFVAIKGIARAQRTGEVVRAKTFIVEDENGTTRVILSVIKDVSGLSLIDENGTPRVLLSVDKDGARMGMYDENGKTRAWLGLDKDGPGLGLYDENGTPRVGLCLDKDGAGLGLDDENGKTRVWLSVDKDGQRLGLYDENGKSTWSAP
jgi:hypothetical protein